MDRSKRALSLAARTDGQVMVEYLAIVGLLVVAGLASWAWWRGAIRSLIRGEAIAAPPACFVAGTPVLTPSGPRAIETLREGDLVIGRGESDGGLAAHRVVRTFARTASELVALEVGGETITVTPEHPLHTEHGWRAAGDLAPGDRVASARAGAWPRVDAITRIARSPEVAVHNLEIDRVHTYFVGSAVLWAHNQCGRRR